MPKRTRTAKSSPNGTTLGFEAKLWKTAAAQHAALLPKLISGEIRVEAEMIGTI